MKSAFEYQLELLKIELDQVDSAIRQMDEMTKSVKNWAIVTWTLCLGTSLATTSLNPYIGLTAIIPLVFWLVDARYGEMQAAFIYRINQISNFLNDERLIKSFDEKKLIDFRILDKIGKKSRDNEYKKDVKLSKSFFYKSNLYLYLGLILSSLVVHLLFHFFI